MSNPGNEPLLDALQRSGLLGEDTLKLAASLFREFRRDPQTLASRLKEIGAITHYQARKVYLSRGHELVFGRYLIMEKIGEGGMGKVYRASDMSLGRMVALKVIRPQLLSNPNVLKRYKREAIATGSLNHPNIVELIHADEINGRYFMAMEYVDGSDLGRLVKENGPLHYAEACEYIYQAALGLHHAHVSGFVHRDVKPSNLLVFGERAIPGYTGKATLKILDMGLVRCLFEEDASLADLTRDGTVVGTPDYMSPEQATDSRNVDGRSDQYSLGCALVYMLRGKPPFPESNVVGKLLAHQRDPVPDLSLDCPNLPEGVHDIVHRLLSKRPTERYSTAAELASALLPWKSNAPLQPVQLLQAAGKSSLHARTLESNTFTTTPRTPVTYQSLADRSTVGSGENTPASVNDRSFVPIRTQRKSGIPLGVILITALMAVLIPMLIVLYVKRAGRDSTTTARKPAVTTTTTASTEPPRLVGFVPIQELIPSGTAAMLVYHPQTYWQRMGSAAPTSRHNQTIDTLTQQFGFDPRLFDRGTVAFSPKGDHILASGEGRFLNSSWIAEFEKTHSKVGKPDESGSRHVHFEKNKLKSEPVAGMIEPAKSTYFLSYNQQGNHQDLNQLHRRILNRQPPTQVDTQWLHTVERATEHRTLAYFAASGSFQIPWKKDTIVHEPLSSYGVEILTIHVYMEEQFVLDITASGPDEALLTQFVTVLLPDLLEGWNITPLADAVNAGRQIPTEESFEKSRKTYTHRVTLPSAGLIAAFEAVLPGKP